MSKSANSRRSGSPSKNKSRSSSSNSKNQCLKLLNSPFVYVVQAIFATAFFYDFTRGEDSIVYSGVM